MVEYQVPHHIDADERTAPTHHDTEAGRHAPGRLLVNIMVPELELRRNIEVHERYKRRKILQ